LDASSKSLEARVLDYLSAHHVVTLATIADGVPWAASVFYANSGYDLFFLSSPNTRHCLDLAKTPQIAATIQEDYDDYAKIKGVQLEGLAYEISGTEETAARKLYGEKFPLVGKLAQAPAFIVKAMAKVRWYRIVPQRLYFIDNSVGFGHRDEVELPS
jgi:uncharacterized protein YhbP (UPF0306 family)